LPSCPQPALLGVAARPLRRLEPGWRTADYEPATYSSSTALRPMRPPEPTGPHAGLGEYRFQRADQPARGAWCSAPWRRDGFTALLAMPWWRPSHVPWRSSTTAATAPGLPAGAAVAPRHVRELTPRLSPPSSKVTSIPFGERTVRVRTPSPAAAVRRHRKADALALEDLDEASRSPTWNCHVTRCRRAGPGLAERRTPRVVAHRQEPGVLGPRSVLRPSFS